ncbi:MAG: hypothetical protein LBN02_06395 [Oscillospiraceae bacterium]|jgi:hypothetical protein|nr:hypothetical protein [Oscillospiraceae bacterium]
MRTTIAALAVALTLVFGIAAASVTAFRKPAAETVFAPNPPASDIAETATPSYTLRVTDGFVAVYTDASDTPMLVTDIDVSHLRRADLEMFESGIVLHSYEQLVELLQDYSN